MTIFGQLAIAVVLSLVACATCFGAGPAYPMYGPNGRYEGYFNENPHNKNLNVYNKYNKYQGRYQPSPRGLSRYHVYDFNNLYGGAIVIPQHGRR